MKGKKRQRRVSSQTDDSIQVSPPTTENLIIPVIPSPLPSASTPTATTPISTGASTPGTASSSIGRGMRGQAKCKKLANVMPGTTLPIRIRGGDAVGTNAQLFTSYLGMIVRSHVPLWTMDFRLIAVDIKKSILQELAQQFTWEHDDYVDDLIIQHARDLLRKYRNRVKKQYFDGRPLEEAYCNIPPTVNDTNQWKKLCDYWNSQDCKEAVSRNKTNRAKLVVPTHVLGRHGLNFELDLYVQKNGREATRIEALELSKSKKKADGSQHWVSDHYKEQFDKINQLVASSTQTDAAGPPLTIDEAFVEVMGKDHSGRVKCAGRGQTPTSWYGNGKGSNTSNSKKVEELQNTINSLQARVAEFEEFKKLMLAKVAELEVRPTSSRVREEENDKDEDDDSTGDDGDSDSDDEEEEEE